MPVDHPMSRAEHSRRRPATAQLMAFAVTFSFASPLWAQLEEKDTNKPVSGDNPGFTNITDPAPPLTLITEQMVAASFPDDQVEVKAPNLLVRFGLLKWLEVRAYAPSLVLSFPDVGDTQADADDFGLGAALATKFSKDVSGSLVPVLVLPVGDDRVGAPGVEGRVQGNIAWTVSKKFTLQAAVRTGWERVRVAPDELSTELSFLGGALAEYSPVQELALFVQSYGLYVDDRDVEPVVGGGVTFWAAPPVALFAAVNAGLTDNSPPVQAIAGAVVRWW